MRGSDPRDVRGTIWFVPIAEAPDTGGEVRFQYPKAQVTDASNAEPDGQLSVD